MTMKNIGLCTACRIDHTQTTLYRSKVDGNLYCIRHYNQLYRKGKITSIEKIYGAFQPNPVVDCGDYLEIILQAKDRTELARTLIDKEDYGKIRQYKWFLSERGYVRTKFMRYGETRRYRLHSLILGEKEGLITDHINHDTLDNRKQNLRHATRAQNGWNSLNAVRHSVTKYKGKFRSSLGYKSKILYLGHWDTREEAEDVIEKVKSALYGEYKYSVT